MNIKQIIWLSLALVAGCPLYGWAQLSKKDCKAAQQVIERVYPELSGRVQIESLSKENRCDRFEQRIEDGRLVVGGSSPVAVCRGVYDFVTKNGYGIASWSGSRLSLPEKLEGSKTQNVTSPFEHHYYFNVVTYGYSMPYWDWHRWEQEIDWMALHGLDMPLALVANEAISARVWRKLGLTDEEIASYFVGPAHLPWMRMGNISGIDGPMPEEWHEDQVALQHKILKRMRSLGMKPICPGFAGFIPKALKRLYPHVKITETSWAGAFHNWMLSPEEELFGKIGAMFIKEWEKEFGKNEYYLADSFNEMDIPFPPKDDPTRYSLLSSYGEKVYQSIREGNKDAVWVMQGWMFGYMRNIWDYKTLQALVSRVPDDKMLLLDLAVDYNRCFWNSEVNWEFYRGFYNKPWVYSVIPNMGGKSGMTGVLEVYANGHLDALKSEHRGRLVAHGMAPEGIENNEVIYELLGDAGWSDSRIDVRSWLENYSLCRYGRCPEGIKTFWNGLLESVYGTFTDHPRYNWQFRPGLVRKGSIHADEDFFAAIESFALCADELKHSAMYQTDLAELTAQYVGGKLELLLQAFETTFAEGNMEGSKQLAAEFEGLANRMDRVLQSHPTLRLERWLDFARRKGHNVALQAYYQKNARRIVTIWGPPVDDYSARIWSGLIRDYYVPRWKHYFESKWKGVPFDFAKWEQDWVEQSKGLSAGEPCQDLVAECLSLMEDARGAVSENKHTSKSEELGGWSPVDLQTKETVLLWNVPVARLKSLAGVEFVSLRGTNHLSVSKVVLEMDGVVVCEGKSDGQSTTIFRFSIPDEASGNNSCVVKAWVKGERGTDTYGVVKMVKR